MDIFWKSLFLCCLFCGGQIVAKLPETTKKAPEHEVKKCVQTEDNDIVCEPIMSDTVDVTSYWPPGPYAIPMSRYGCPESSIHGWHESYLLLTWKDQQEGYVNISAESHGMPLETMVKITNMPFYQLSYSRIFGPAKPYTFKLNFCFKYRSNASLDVGEWPDGNYSIYSANAGCPDGFELHASNSSIPNISRWASHGNTPIFEMLNDSTEGFALQMQLCYRTSAQNISRYENFVSRKFSTGAVETSLNNTWTYFFLIQIENMSCPMFENFSLQKETVYFEKPGVNGATLQKSLNTLCYYERNILQSDKHWLVKKRLKEAYQLKVQKLTEGKTPRTNLVGKEIIELAVFKPLITWYNVNPWIVFDLGRTISVSAVQINVHEVLLCKVFTGYLGCFISKGKWDFLYVEAASCPFIPDCANVGNTYGLVFIRAMEGRYVTICNTYHYQLFFKNVSYKVFTEQIIYDTANTRSCNVDLGLGNFRIKDDQISASSWLPEYQPAHARPYNTGWCAAFHDGSPYIEINFPETVIIEGITVYNWETIISFDTQETSKLVLFGVTELMLLYKVNGGHFIIYNKSIIFDTSRVFTQPQTIWLADRINTESVRIMLLKAATSGLNCMKFELQGCYSTRNYQLVNTIPKTQSYLSYEAILLLSNITSAGDIIVSTDLLHRYESDQIYKWIIRLDDFQFVTLVFTDISFKNQKQVHDGNNSTCTDSLIISDDLMHIDSGRVIDHNFQIKYSMTVETSEAKLVLSLYKCQSQLMADPGGSFRAVVKYQDIPACFSLRPRIPWNQGQLETCTKPTMLLTSMNYLGVPFFNTTERWTISVPMHKMNLQIIEFYVTCQNDYTKSLFKVIDMDQERSYCNFDRPPDSINSSYSTLTVSFYKDVDLRTYVKQIDGFKLVYYALRQTMSYLIDYMEPYSTDRNVALGKPAVKLSTVGNQYEYSENFVAATKATDGQTFQDIGSGSCFLSNMDTDDWWIVDLQGIYKLEYIVIYNALTITRFPARNIKVSTGLNVYGLRVTGFFCGITGSTATIMQSKVRARYLQLQQVAYVGRYFSLCEVMVFGKLESDISHTSLGVEFVMPRLAGIAVDGLWGQWSSWEDICYKGKQMRYRTCDSSRSGFYGTCRGRDNSYQLCIHGGHIEDKVMKVYPSNGDVSNVDVGYDWTADLSEKGYIPWLLADLNTIDHLVYVDIAFDAFSDHLRRNGDQEEYMVLSSGITLCDFRVQFHFRSCEDLSRRKLIRLNGIRTRYVKLNLTGLIIKEFSIFSQTVYSESFHYENNSCIEHNSDGKFNTWSEWGTCSANCGHGLSTRTRTCNNPKSTGGGLPCFGDVIEYRPCTGNGSCLVCSDTFGKCYGIIARLTNWKQAQLECSRRKMNLVSILSLQEMHFVKTLLRERRYLDGNPVNVFDADYYVHIGLYIEHNDIIRVWDNGLLALFTAWKSKLALQCTRMNFKLFDEDDSWETEDCEHQLAEYIMCEHQSKNVSRFSEAIKILNNAEKLKIHEQIPSWKYNGTGINRAISGDKCKNLCVSFGNGKHCTGNYCHDSAAWGYLRCTTSLLENVECSINLPEIENSSLVYYKYLGKLNTTFSGKTCQRWDKKIPHNHGFQGNVFKGEGISEAANYCRDHGDTGILWCFTTDSAARWEPCILNELKAERLCTTNMQYNGTNSITLTGKTCLRWDEIQHSSIPAVKISNAENYCRDPFNYGYSWCYVDSFQQIGDYITVEPCRIDIQHSVHMRHVPKSVDTFFSCENGLLIPELFRCNGLFDCADRSDEAHCLNKYQAHTMVKLVSVIDTPTTFEFGSYFQCSTKEWISLIARCDGVIDCFDASDEINCYNRTLGLNNCTVEEFMCTNGDCIHMSQVCNYVVDCIDSSDEYCDTGPCLPTEYQCDSGQCISSNQRCDAIRQCLDGSDEVNCESCQPNVALHCDVIRCIPIRLRCDKYVDCKDGSDEELCEDAIFTSCQELWEAGYRQSRKYVIDGIKVDCKFSSEEGKFTTIVNFDVYYEGSGTLDRFLINRPFKAIDGLLSKLLTGKNCTQQMIQTCYPSYEAAAALTGNNTCNCSRVSFDMETSEHTRITECSGTARMDSESQSKQEIYFDYQLSKGSRVIHLDEFLPDYYLMLPGPAFCETDFMSKHTKFACRKDGHVIPWEQRCVFDLDQSGFPLGCRDGSHLFNCEHYDCPRHAVRCPESYCIASRFVCDGELHCPGGEDEENCGCAPSNNEILILHDDGNPKDLDIGKFSRQFKTKTNIVRVLSYEMSRPLIPYGVNRSLLEIRDVEISHRPDVERLSECRYRVFAKGLINSIHFTNAGLKGIILVQNDEISEAVNAEILEDITAFGNDIKIYRAMETSEQLIAFDNQTALSMLSDVHIKRWKFITAVGAEYFSELCNITSKVNCSNGYKCAASKTCIPLEQVCDGNRQCLHGDDELLCNFQCPRDCSCAGFYSDCSGTDFQLSKLSSIPLNTRYLDLSLNHKLSLLLQESRLNIKLLSVLNVSGCNVKAVSRHAFDKIRNLRILDISFNKLTRISNYVFSNLKQLTQLILLGNADIAVLEEHAFNSLFRVQDLNLSNMKLRKVSARTFAGFNLTSVDLSNNKLEAIEDFAFSDSAIGNINFAGNDIKLLNKEVFTGLIGLKTLRTSAFKFCCIRPNYVREENCYPRKDEFSSCEDLMRNPALQFLLWLIGAAALIGNLLTIIYRIKYDSNRLKLGFGIFVTNLAVADFLMGCYLVIIAIADATFRKRYIYVSDYWKSSAWCNFAGVLSTISSEASVLFLCLVTLDRILIIKFPFGDIRLSKEKSLACTVGAWLFAISVGVFPVSYEQYFKNKFYSRSGVCIALPLTRDRPPGWVYSLALFVGLNFITFIMVAFGQISIFVGMRESTGIATTAEAARKRDLKVARNLLLVVATDFMCWFPIGIMGVLALSGHVISGDVYAWAAVFILPINSALNPILYTLTAIIGDRKFRPSTQEQSVKQIVKDIGESVLTFHTISSRITQKKLPTSKYCSLDELTNADTCVPMSVILTVAAQLAQILDAMRCCSLGLKHLDETSIYLRCRKKQLTGAVRIKGSLFISFKPEDNANDIYKFGIFLRGLINTRKKNI